MTAKTAPANAAAPITAAAFLLRFFFTALQISMAQTTQTAATASAITSVSHNHESSYNILIRSPYLSLANWKLLFHIHAFAKSRFIPLLSPPLRFWVFQQVRLLRNPFQPLSFFLRQLPVVQGLCRLCPAVSRSGKSCHRQYGRRQAAVTAGQSGRDCTAS